MKIPSCSVNFRFLLTTTAAGYIWREEKWTIKRSDLTIFKQWCEGLFLTLSLFFLFSLGVCVVAQDLISVSPFLIYSQKPFLPIYSLLTSPCRYVMCNTVFLGLPAWLFHWDLWVLLLFSKGYVKNQSLGRLQRNSQIIWFTGVISCCIKKEIKRRKRWDMKIRFYF